MPSVITDNPVAGAAVAFIAAFFGVLTAFGVPLTQGQIAALTVLFIAGLALFLILQKTTVPKTPSSIAATASLQSPPPGASLVTNAGAATNGPVPPSEILATTPAPTP